MALNTPSNLYSGYAQVFNDAPHLAFQARLLHQHAAKMQALDDYYRKLPLTINDKGVRNQDRPEISKSMLEIKGFGIKNKEKLRDDPEAQFTYEQMIREHQDLVGRSQEAGLTDVQVGKLKFNPSTTYMFQPINTVEKLAAHHLPVNDPNHVDFDLEEFTAPPKPLVKDTYMKRYDKLKFDDYKTTVSNLDGTQTITNTPKPSKDALDNIMSGATYDYLHDPSVTQAIDQLPADNSNPYNEIFKKNYGRDIANPIDATSAFILANKLPQPTTEVIKTDQNAMLKKREAFAMNKMYANDALIRGRMKTAQGYKEAFSDYKEAKSTEAQNGIINKYLDNTFEAGSNRINGTDIKAVNIDGKIYKGKVIEVPNSIKKEYISYDAKGEPHLPNNFYLTEDKKTIIPLFLGDKVSTGGYHIKSESKPQDIQTFKAALSKILLTQKARGGEVTSDEFDVEEPPKTETKARSKTTRKITIEGL